MSCIFCRIVNGELNAHQVLEDDRTIAFLDNQPLFAGHCLVVPKNHHETLMDLPAELLPELFSNAQLLARAVEQGLGAEGSFIAINNRVSQTVPHLHVHVVPRRKKDGLKGFFWPRNPYKDSDEMRRTQQILRDTVAALRKG